MAFLHGFHLGLFHTEISGVIKGPTPLTGVWGTSCPIFTLFSWNVWNNQPWSWTPLNLIIGGKRRFLLKPERSGSIYVEHWGVQNLLVLCALKNLSNNIWVMKNGPSYVGIEINHYKGPYLPAIVTLGFLWHLVFGGIFLDPQNIYQAKHRTSRG